jgi:hypothetical protein
LKAEGIILTLNPFVLTGSIGCNPPHRAAVGERGQNEAETLANPQAQSEFRYFVFMAAVTLCVALLAAVGIERAPAGTGGRGGGGITSESEPMADEDSLNEPLCPEEDEGEDGEDDEENWGLDQRGRAEFNDSGGADRVGGNALAGGIAGSNDDGSYGGYGGDRRHDGAVRVVERNGSAGSGGSGGSSGSGGGGGNGGGKEIDVTGMALFRDFRFWCLLVSMAIEDGQFLQ